MKKNLVVIALLAALTIVFFGCTEAGADFDVSSFWNQAPFAGAEAWANNNGQAGTYNAATGVFTVGTLTVDYQSLVTFEFPGGIQPGASNFLIDYIADVPGTTKWTGKKGYKSGTGDWYNQTFSDGLNQLVVPVSRLGPDGFTIELAEAAQNAAFKIKFLATSWN